MPILDAIVWLVIILGLGAIALWALSQVSIGRFAYPVKVVIISVMVIAVIYLAGGLLLSFAPPFPGR